MLTDIANIIYSLGYPGVFLSGFLSTFTLFLPSPTFMFVFFMARFYNPFLLGVIGGIGAAIGEMIGYYVGYGVGFLAEKWGKTYEKTRKKMEKLFERHHPDLIIFVFSAMPFLPFDAVGIFCGAVDYDTKRFFTVTLAGKIVKYLVLAYTGYYGIKLFSSYFPEFFG